MTLMQAQNTYIDNATTKERTMSNQAAYTEIAADWSLWNEFVNTDATMSRDEFDSLTIEQKVALQVEAFGPEIAAA
jgi:hypothetical protein